MLDLPITIETRRLLLRQPAERDIAALVRELGRLQVSRWLGRVPHPYVPRHARQYLAFQRAARASRRDLAYVIALKSRPGVVIGGIGAHEIDDLRPVIGYWLAERHWGRGYASEALRALLGRLLVLRPGSRPQATAPRGNSGSIGVLRKAGFSRRPGREWLACRSRGHKVEVVRFAWAASSNSESPWQAAPRSEPRLKLRPVDEWMPPPPAALLPAWAQFDCLTAQGQVVGRCGLLFREDGGVEVGYRIAPEHRRQGHAREALRLLIRHAFQDLALLALEAEVAEDNTPSLRLLGRLGFADTGKRREQWSARRQAYISYQMHRRSRGPTGSNP